MKNFIVLFKNNIRGNIWQGTKNTTTELLKFYDDKSKSRDLHFYFLD